MQHKNNVLLLTDLFQFQIINLIQLANQKRINLLAELITIYGDELEPTYEPNFYDSWFDLKWEIHLQKISWAKELKILFNAPIKNLIELKKFTSHLTHLENTNLKLDEKPDNRFAKMLAKIDIKDIDAQIVKILNTKRNIAESMLTILRNMSAMAQEKKHQAEGSTQTFYESHAFEYHIFQIDNHQNLLIEILANYSKENYNSSKNKAPIPHNAEQELKHLAYANKIIEDIKIYLENVSDTLSLEDKIVFFENSAIPYLLEKYQINTVFQQAQFASLNIEDQVKYALFHVVAMNFIENLKFAEKPLLWELFCRESGNNLSKLFADEHQLKLELYREYFTEHDNIDPLNTNTLISDLLSIINEPIRILDLKGLITEIAETVIKHEDILTQNEEQSTNTPEFVSQWKNQIVIRDGRDNMMNQFFHSLKTLEHFFNDKLPTNYKFINNVIDELRILFPNAVCLNRLQKIQHFVFFQQKMIPELTDVTKAILQNYMALTEPEERQNNPAFS